jgi:hypothetical protein
MNFRTFLSIFVTTLSIARAEFILIEDFDGLTEGALDSQNGWVADIDYTVVPDPDRPSNLILQYLFGAQAGAHKDLMANALAEGEEGTLFYRFRFDATGNGNTGFSDVASPVQYNDFESQVNRQANTPIKGRDGGGFQDLSPIDSALLADDPDIWYNIWLVADNETDTSRVFIQSNDDPDFLVQTEVGPPDGIMNFRFGTAESLATLMLRAQEGTVLWDDIYISPGVDLSNPAPVPGTNGDVEITGFEVIAGASVELTWRSISGYKYAIETSPNLVDWTALTNEIVADSATTTAELFDDDITPINGRLYFRIKDIGVNN